MEQNAKMEIKKIPQRRTLSQNAYLHVLFSLWGNEYGYSIDESKIVVKRALKYIYERNGETFLRQTSGMDSKELTGFIDRFRNWSASEGFYLPTANEIGENYADYAYEIDRAERNQKQYSF